MGGPPLRCPDRPDFLYSPEGAFIRFSRCDSSHLNISRRLVSADILGFNLQL